MTSVNPNPSARNFGMLVSAMLALLLFALSLYAVTIPDDKPYAIMIPIVIAALVGGPLLAITFGISIYLLVKGSGGMLWRMWLPVIACAAIYPATMAYQTRGFVAFYDAHPEIKEVHVNLSGHDLWLDADNGNEVLPGHSLAPFVAVTRRASIHPPGDKMQAYRGGQLAPDFKRMTVHRAMPPGAPSVMPVVVTPEPADWAPLLLGKGDSLQRKFFYYHYTDRVEVVPVVGFGNGDHRGESPRSVPVVGFYPHNLSGETIVRLEVNGQALPATTAILPEDAASCSFWPVTATNRLDAPLTVRWQVLQTDPVWRQATVAVPAWPHPQPANSVAAFDNIELFILPDGSLAAQRGQQLTLASGKTAVRNTGVAPAGKSASCPSGAERYDPADTSFERLP